MLVSIAGMMATGNAAMLRALMSNLQARLNAWPDAGQRQAFMEQVWRLMAPAVAKGVGLALKEQSGPPDPAGGRGKQQE